MGFLGEVLATREPDEEIHVILDNLSAHKTKAVAAFLDEHPKVTLHFTPTYPSWRSTPTARAGFLMGNLVPRQSTSRRG